MSLLPWLSFALTSKDVLAVWNSCDYRPYQAFRVFHIKMKIPCIIMNRYLDNNNDKKLSFTGRVKM